MSGSKGSIVMATFWMILISLLLFWLPGLGPLIAGIVGGKVAGGVMRGLAAVFVPALLLGAALFAFGTALTGMPLIGAVAGGGLTLLILVQVAPLAIGALIGGLLA